MICFVPEIWDSPQIQAPLHWLAMWETSFSHCFSILIKHICRGSVWVVSSPWLMSADRSDTWQIHFNMGHSLLSCDQELPCLAIQSVGFLICAVSNIECLCSFSDELWFWPCWGCAACFGNTCNIPGLFVFHPNMLLHSCNLSLVVMQCLAGKQRIQMENSAPVKGKCSETVTESVLLETRQRFPEN